MRSSGGFSREKVVEQLLGHASASHVRLSSSLMLFKILLPVQVLLIFVSSTRQYVTSKALFRMEMS